MNVLNGTEMYTLTRLILCYVNCTSVRGGGEVKHCVWRIRFNYNVKLVLPQQALNFPLPEPLRLSFSDASSSSTSKLNREGMSDSCNRNPNARQTPRIKTGAQGHGKERESNEGVEFLP